MLTTYPACFFKEEDGYSVIFPDLNYLATCGSSVDEAMTMAIDCLAGYIFWCNKDSEEVPAPSPIEKVSPSDVSAYLDFEFDEAFTTLVSVDVNDYAKKHFEKAVKKTLTIPSWLNKAAIEQGINFSQVLQEALLAKIKGHY